MRRSSCEHAAGKCQRLTQTAWPAMPNSLAHDLRRWIRRLRSIRRFAGHLEMSNKRNHAHEAHEKNRTDATGMLHRPVFIFSAVVRFVSLPDFGLSDSSLPACQIVSLSVCPIFKLSACQVFSIRSSVCKFGQVVRLLSGQPAAQHGHPARQCVVAQVGGQEHAIAGDEGKLSVRPGQGSFAFGRDQNRERVGE